MPSWPVSEIARPAGPEQRFSDCPLVLVTGEATRGILCPVPGASLQEGHFDAGASPEKDSEASEGSGGHVL